MAVAEEVAEALQVAEVAFQSHHHFPRLLLASSLRSACRMTRGCFQRRRARLPARRLLLP